MVSSRYIDRYMIRLHYASHYNGFINNREMSDETEK